MKKFIYRTAPMAVICMAVVLFTTCCKPCSATQRLPPKTITTDNGDQSEIIIRQKGDKDTKITLEIKNGEYFINGKPLEKFDDQNVIVEKREIDGDHDAYGLYSPSPFRMNPWNDEGMERDLQNQG